jgi:hypothetical protein
VRFYYKPRYVMWCVRTNIQNSVWCIIFVHTPMFLCSKERPGAFYTHKHRCTYFNNKAPRRLIQLRTGVSCIHTHCEKNLRKNLHPPNFSSFMNHPLKPSLFVAEVFLQNSSIFVTLKSSAKTFATMCSPRSI